VMSREAGRDRVSVHGFGSGGIDERNRKRGKGRVGIVVGSLYLQAGRWQDALRELQENTSKARDVGDHIWHAKGLECMLTTLVLLAWTGTEFQVIEHMNPT
jgi:trafficking protein particle complex subunit 9